MDRKLTKKPLIFIGIGIALTLSILLIFFFLKSITQNPTEELGPTVTPIPGIIITGLDQSEKAEEYVTQLAVSDLASTENIPEDEIKVVNVIQQEWSNGSLGCPKPGTMYAQVITPGYKVVLEANDQTFNYHTSLESVIRCN